MLQINGLTDIDAAFLGEQAVPPTVGKDRRAVGVEAVQALEEYVRAQQTVSPALTGNIKAV